MDSAWIGFIGVVGGVILTNVFLIIDKKIDKAHNKSERWIEDKKQSYIDFILNADLYFKYALSVLAGGPSAKNDSKVATDARMKLNNSIAIICIVGSERAIKAAESLEKWMHNTLVATNGTKLSDDDRNNLKNDFIKRKKRFNIIVREDFSN